MPIMPDRVVFTSGTPERTELFLAFPRAYEPYTNYDISTEGKLYQDLLRDSVITFANELGADVSVSAQDQTVDGHEIKRVSLNTARAGPNRRLLLCVLSLLKSGVSRGRVPDYRN